MNLLPRRKQGGFTLLDSALTMLVLSVGMLSSMMVMQNANGQSVESDIRTVAGHLAEQKIEMILGDKAFQGFDAVTEESYPDENLQGGYQGYSRSVEVREVSSDLETDEPGSGLKKVTVTVSWGEESDQTVSLSTLLGSQS